MSIEKQISIIKNEIKDKADLVAVSKTRTVQEIQEAYNSGQLKFGENRVQEAVHKLAKQTIPQNIEFHLIGHLQSNKVNKAISIFDVIQTVDSLSLAKRFKSNVM